MIGLIIFGLFIWAMLWDTGAFHTHDYGLECAYFHCFEKGFFN